MLTRIDFLKNKDPVKRLDIILQNSLDYKEQTISVSIYCKGIGGSQDCSESGETTLEKDQEKATSKAVNWKIQPSI